MGSEGRAASACCPPIARAPGCLLRTCSCCRTASLPRMCLGVYWHVPGCLLPLTTFAPTTGRWVAECGPEVFLSQGAGFSGLPDWSSADEIPRQGNRVPGARCNIPAVPYLAMSTTHCLPTCLPNLPAQPAYHSLLRPRETVAAQYGAPRLPRLGGQPRGAGEAELGRVRHREAQAVQRQGAPESAKRHQRSQTGLHRQCEGEGEPTSTTYDHATATANATATTITNPFARHGAAHHCCHRYHDHRRWSRTRTSQRSSGRWRRNKRTRSSSSQRGAS